MKKLNFFCVLTAPVVVPLVLSFIHFHNVLTSNQCILFGYQDHVDRYCRPSFVATLPAGVRYESALAPSLITLSDFIRVATSHNSISSPFLQRHSSSLLSSLIDEKVQWDNLGWKIKEAQEDQNPRAIIDYVPRAAESSNGGSPTQTSYGFRRNEHRTSRRVTPGPPVPIATGVILAMNIGMFLWLWNSRVEPSQVALNGQIYHDFGRAVTGNLSHFEIWHIGFNMMTLSSMGPSLELKQGSIPFFLWTMSFVTLVTLAVIGLHYVHRRFHSTRQHANPFPSMVGFSGILFAWMVVSTLDGQRSCPIVFLPNLCFDTMEFLDGGLRVSFGPLVQLVFLQMVLPRVSFFGHLGGIIVGFLWHWKLLPSLEWFQPCILFPVLWMICKYLCFEHFRGIHSTNGRDMITVAGNTWNSDLSSSEKRLTFLQMLLLLHGGVLYIHSGSLWGSAVISQFLLILILFTMIRTCRHQQTETRNEWFGAMGRGYIVLVVVLLFTDGLTMGGWCATWKLWTNAKTACCLLVVRDILFVVSMSITVHTLNMTDDAPSCGGTWAIMVWPSVRHFRSLVESLEYISEFYTGNFDVDRTEWCKRRKGQEIGLHHTLELETSESTELV